MENVTRFNDFELNELVGFGDESNTIDDFSIEVKE